LNFNSLYKIGYKSPTESKSTISIGVLSDVKSPIIKKKFPVDFFN